MFNKSTPLIEVYRLEARNGLGPFECDKYQKCVQFLAYHEEPIYMLEHINLNETKFENLTRKQNYIFAWIDEEKYLAFFKSQKKFKPKLNHEFECYIHGMRKMKYSTRDYYIFPDGQVLFLPSKHHQALDVTPDFSSYRNKKMKALT